MDGVLGCPVCGAEFPLEAGVARFGFPARPTPAARPDPALAERLAAFLDLTDTRGFALLCGEWGAQLDAIQRLTDTPLVLVNPPTNCGGDPAGVIVCDGVLPLAASSARSAALDGTADAGAVASTVRAVRVGGRLVGPTALAIPEGVSELTRDTALWVGERASLQHLHSLSRAPH